MKRTKTELDTVYDRVIPLAFPPIVKEPVCGDIFDIIEPDHFYALLNQHRTAENDQTIHNETQQCQFAERNMPGVSERKDDVSGEFECVDTCGHDEAGNEGPGSSQYAETMPTGTFTAPPSLQEAQLALDADGQVQTRWVVALTL